MAELRLQINEDGAGSVNEMTYKDVYDMWIQQHKLEVKPTTYRAINSKFKRILPKFGHLKITAITGLYCQKVINEWAKELKTFHDYKIQANLVFKYAMRYDLIQKNPMEHVTMPKLQNQVYFNEDEEKVNFFNQDQLEEFLSKARGGMHFKDFALFQLLAFTGMRKGEALALHCSDIDFEHGYITIQKTLDMEKGKNYLQTVKTIDARRVIDVGQKTLSVLKEWQDIQMEEYSKAGLHYEERKEPVFTRFNPQKVSMNYMRLASPNDTLTRFFANHEEFTKITVHGFRHTHASLLFELGATVKAVQARLGHSDIQTTMNIYTHLSKSEKEKTAKLFDDHIDF
ncbi:tyrosine-type recombinase/integrase [Shouchella rhizosphaerae]|uniref:tyrosine-type recombinase/integrase n=1 Tax=Shouchella rhizosphaerae TaxID=866786 RepID=UPI00203E2CFA|nr:site-specific integrase [Shouchella rhizosphaerae]MCM3382130.1 site-specific integrase [Shouchella rhizosphaerae]